MYENFLTKYFDIHQSLGNAISFMVKVKQKGDNMSTRDSLALPTEDSLELSRSLKETYLTETTEKDSQSVNEKGFRFF